ncbi:MAG: hypothetical protein NVV82_12975 [Sporocytophaga sp.]|jgi:hypothetical protein|nr:hypothetical protein [Sporocytophaga sp.]
MKIILHFFVAILILASCKPKSYENNSYQSNQFNSIPLDDSVLIKKVEFLNTVKSKNKYNKLGKRTGKWTIFLDGNFNRTDNLEIVEYYRVINYKNGKYIGTITDYYSNGSRQWTGYLADDTINEIIIGKATWYDRQGRLTQINHYKDGIKDGEEVNYDTSGNITSRIVYPLKHVKLFEVRPQYKRRTHDSRECEYCGEEDECGNECECEGGCDRDDCQCVERMRRNKQYDDEDSEGSEDSE